MCGVWQPEKNEKMTGKFASGLASGLTFTAHLLALLARAARPEEGEQLWEKWGGTGPEKARGVWIVSDRARHGPQNQD